MLLADDERFCVDANQGACLLLRSSRDHLLAKPLDEWLPSEEREALKANWAELLERGTLASHMHLRVPPGEPEPVGLTATAHVVPGRHLVIMSSPVSTEPAADDAPETPISAREREILALVAAGETTGNMARVLFISQETVKRHVKNAMTKLDARTRAQAVAIAVRRGELTI